MPVLDLSAGAASPSVVGRVPERTNRTADQWAAVVTKTVGGLSVLAAAFLFHDDEVGMTPDEAFGIGEPAGKLLARTKFGKRAAKRIGVIDETIDLAFGVWAYGGRMAERDSVREKVSVRRAPKRQTEPVQNHRAGGGIGSIGAALRRPSAGSAVNAAAAGTGPADSASGGGPGSGGFTFPGVASGFSAASGHDPLENGHAVDFGTGIKPRSFN